MGENFSNIDGNISCIISEMLVDVSFMTIKYIVIGNI